MEKQKGFASKEQTDLKTVKGFMKKDDIVVVGFFTDNKEASYTLYQDSSKYLMF